ncbi:MAG: hypothetical protein ACPGNV_03660 [Mangrovicoccus sp.]
MSRITQPSKRRKMPGRRVELLRLRLAVGFGFAADLGEARRF